jgi:hypothetical protein
MGESPVMTLRERALKVLRGEAPDVVPWFGDLDYWATALIGRGLKPDGFKTSPEYVDWHRELRVGFYLQGYFPYRMVFPDIRIEQWHEGPDRVRRLETPSGVLRERWRWLADSFAEAPVEHLVKTAEDMPAYAWLYRNLCYEPDHRLALERLGYVGGQGLVLAYLPKSPLMQMIALDAGIEAVVNILADDPAALADALEAVGESHTRAAEIAVASPAEVLMIPENLSSEVVGVRFYEKYLRPYHEAWTARIREAGKISCVHLDGTLRGLLSRVASAGFDFIEAMTPAPAGDVPVSEWASLAGSSRTVLWGGLPGVYFTPLIGEAEFERHFREVLDVMRREPRYVLGVADQVPPDGLESRVRRVADLVERYGRF